MFFHRKQLAYEHTTNFLDHKLNYRIIGSGKPVIMVHGMMQSRDWLDFEKEVEKHYTAYILDLPGFGASDHIRTINKYSVELFAQALETFIKTMEFGQVPIIAISMGTLVVIRAAADGVAKGKLVLAGMPVEIAGGSFDIVNKMPLSIKRLALKTDFGRRKILLPLLEQSLHEDAKYTEANKLSLMEATHPHTVTDIDLDYETRVNLPKYLPLVKNEKIFLYGDQDPLRLAAKKLIDHYEVISGAQHNIYNTQPKLAIKRVVEFLGT